MKRILLTMAVTCITVGIQGQGSITFNNFGGSGTSAYRFPIYGPEIPDFQISKTGNTTAGIPGGTQIYTGPLLAGSQYSAQLFAAPGANVDVSLLVAAPAITTFRTGAAAGFLMVTTATLPGVPRDAPVATVMMCVWDNQGGLFPDWASASHGGTFVGMSAPINVYDIGGDLNVPPTLKGMESFNIYRVVPEPGVMALAGLGAAALLIFRRRK